MSFVLKSWRVFVFSAFFGLMAMPAADAQWREPDRTANRDVVGRILYPDWVFAKPEHYEFTPLVSNHDTQNQHPGAWAGQDWEPAQWGKGWTPDKALQNFFAARIFVSQSMQGGKAAVVELGPTFYKLSDLDRRRTLKLLTDGMGAFKKGYRVVELVDWATHEIVGTYTPKGMFLH